jgi:hypothetical protein
MEHVTGVLPLQDDPAGEQAFVQHCAEPAAPKHAPFVHGVEPIAYKHPIESVWHVTYDAVPWHVFPAVVQVGSVLQEQDADPGMPVQLWCSPQGTGAP